MPYFSDDYSSTVQPHRITTETTRYINGNINTIPLLQRTNNGQRIIDVCLGRHLRVGDIVGEINRCFIIVNATQTVVAVVTYFVIATVIVVV